MAPAGNDQFVEGPTSETGERAGEVKRTRVDDKKKENKKQKLEKDQEEATPPNKVPTETSIPIPSTSRDALASMHRNQLSRLPPPPPVLPRSSSTSDNILILQENPIKYQCKICLKSFTSKNYIRYHDEFCAKSTPNPFKCSKCGKEFKVKSHYNYHSKSQHSNERPQTCHLCPKKFVRKTELDRHIRSHSGARPFACDHDQCDRRFASNQMLQNHLKIHSGVKGFACPHCDKRFYNKILLSRHILVHTGKTCEKKFPCLRMIEEVGKEPKQCIMSFTTSRDLNRHVSAVHDKLKPFECPLCGRDFNRRENFNRHVTTVHGLTTSTVVENTTNGHADAAVADDKDKSNYENDDVSRKWEWDNVSNKNEQKLEADADYEKEPEDTGFWCIQMQCRPTVNPLSETYTTASGMCASRVSLLSVSANTQVACEDRRAEHLKPEVYKQQWLQDGGPPSVDGSPKLLLHHALCSKKTEDENVFLELIDNIVDADKDMLHALDNAGNNPILLATLLGYSRKVLIRLVNFGADWKCRNKWNESILHLALAAENIDALEYFVKKNADRNVRDLEKCTSIHKLWMLKDEHVFKMALQLLQVDNNDNEWNAADYSALDNEGNSSLHYLAENRSGSEIKEFLNISCEYKSKSKSEYLNRVRVYLTLKNLRGLTPIHVAMASGNTKVLRFLMDDLGMKAEDLCFSRRADKETPLHEVAISTTKNFEQVTKFLLNKGFDIDSKDAHGHSPFLVAVQMGRSPKELEFLIELGANWRLKNNKGEGVLHLAASKGHLEILKHFIEKRAADLGAKSNSKETLFHQLASAPENFIPILGMLQEKELATPAILNEINNYGQSFLMKCILMNRPKEDIEYVFQLGCDYQTVDHNGYSLLHMAAQAASSSVLKYLLDEKKMNANTKCNIGRTPLHLVMFSKKQPIQKVNSLVEYGADINACDMDGDSVIFLSAKEKKGTKMLERLVKHGADWSKVKSREQGAFSILHEAVAKDNLEAVKYFVSLGADVTARDKNGETPVHKVRFVEKNAREMLSILCKQNGADINAKESSGNNTLLLISAMRKSGKELAEMIEFGAVIKDRNVRGYTVLHTAAFYGNLSGLEYCISAGADISAVATNGKLPIHCLVKTKSYFQEMLRVLLDKGPYGYINEEDANGYTILDLVARNEYGRRSIEDLKYLVNNCNAHFRKITTTGQTLLHLAAIGGNIEGLNYFAELGIDVDCTDQDDLTPLHYVGMGRRNIKGMLDVLFDNLANVSAVDKNGQNVLHKAAVVWKRDSFEQFAKLMSSKVGYKVLNHLIMSKDSAGRTPLDIAKNKGNQEGVECFNSARGTWVGCL